MVAVNIRKWLGSDWIEAVIRIIVAVTAIITIALVINQSRIVTCQAKYNQAYAESASASRNARDQDDAARDKLFRAIYDARQRNNTLTQKDIDAAFVEYFTTRKLTDQQRQNNPPPRQPTDYCG